MVLTCFQPSSFFTAGLVNEKRLFRLDMGPLLDDSPSSVSMVTERPLTHPPWECAFAINPRRPQTPSITPRYSPQRVGSNYEHKIAIGVPEAFARKPHNTPQTKQPIADLNSVLEYTTSRQDYKMNVQVQKY